MPADVTGGPGWIISAADLRPRITDADAFAEGLASDSLARAIALLWSGDPAAALHFLEGQPQTQRVRALRADCSRDLGDAARAVLEYNALVDESRGTASEAVMRQHRGKAWLAANDVAGAVQDFEMVVALRQDADASLLASATQALEVARERRDAEAVQEQHGGRAAHERRRPEGGLAVLDPGVRRVLEGPSISHLAILLRDGSPHAIPIWIGARGEQIVFFTGLESFKARNLRRDPRVAISIAPVDRPFEPVSIRGHVVEWIEGEAGWEIVDQIAKPYMDGPYPRTDERVVAVIEPDKQIVGTRGASASEGG